MLKYILKVRTHSGTLMSRDVDNPKEFSSKEEALEEFKQDKEWYNSIGRKIWFANIIYPNGKEETLESNEYY